MNMVKTSSQDSNASHVIIFHFIRLSRMNDNAFVGSLHYPTALLEFERYLQNDLDVLEYSGKFKQKISKVDLCFYICQLSL